MPDNESSDSSVMPAAINLLLLLVTVVGGVFLVSNKLASSRPVETVKDGSIGIGIQTVDTRLWEDPMRKMVATAKPALNPSELRQLVGLAFEETTEALVLPVMVPGGPHSEDRESRVRSRFAIVSALGTQGYAPVDAAHIGVAPIPWPDTSELMGAARRTNFALPLYAEEEPPRAGTNAVLVGSRILDVRFEWYRQRTFAPTNDQPSRVLVIWLDDDCFEDDPLLRLAHLRSVLGRNDWHVIGPRKSSTLRAMLPSRGEGNGSRAWSSAVTNAVSHQLTGIALFSATANAMDEVLVTNPTSTPREAVARALTRSDANLIGFKQAGFFNATDAQLAAEMISELKRRHVDLAKPTDHLVLLSEWDTFYGRMLTLTYGAELSTIQRSNSNRADFVKNYRDGNVRYPSNFHRLVYLRGLDGEVISEAAATQDGGGRRDQNSPKVGSIEDLIQWRPDANQAEGSAQFDYLSRVGDWIAELRQNLDRAGKGNVKAIGIVGSDAYDVMLINQALRDRFPDVYFFTTDLDARLWHPDQLPWTRNLIVASSYGLRVSDVLQQGVATFRDASQTAQYLAGLAALGHPRLANFSPVASRLFEIGNKTAVDLSVDVSGDGRGGIHYPTRSQVPVKGSLLKAFLLMGTAASLLIYFAWNPLRRRLPTDVGFFSQRLRYTDADVGGPVGARLLIEKINALAIADPPGPSQALLVWFRNALRPLSEHIDDRMKKDDEPTSGGRQVKARIARRDEMMSDAFVGLLNDVVDHIKTIPKDNFRDAALTFQAAIDRACPWSNGVQWWKGLQRLIQRRRTRQFVDQLLDFLTDACDHGGKEFVHLKVARDSRSAADSLYCTSWQYLAGVLFVLVSSVWVLANLGTCIWIETWHDSGGEPFSFSSGTSAWPNIIVRVVSAISAVLFIILFLLRLRVMYLTLSRDYRIPLFMTSPPLNLGRVCASEVWRQSYLGGQLSSRLFRALIPMLLYFSFGFALLTISGLPHQPARGPSSFWWATASTVFTSVPLFLFLSFLTIDAALRCRNFIRLLSAAPTEYPHTTRAHFRRLRGDVGDDYLDEWIDVQLIADLTEKVDRLLWFPSIVFLLMLVSRNQWTDNWPTSPALMIILAINFGLSLASVLILQSAAIRAKRTAEKSLEAKVKRARGAVAETRADNDSDQAEGLLEEIRNLRRGAFVRFRENPVFGALLLPSFGLVVVQLLTWLSSR